MTGSDQTIRGATSGGVLGAPLLRGMLVNETAARSMSGIHSELWREILV